jgi:hypothetical protein
MKCCSPRTGRIEQLNEVDSPIEVMLARQEILMVDAVAEHSRPIEFQTDNAFSIIRFSDLNHSIGTTGFVHQFLVRDPDGFELEVTVEITATLANALARRSRGHLPKDSLYWICCAERHLAEYLWSNEDYPPNAKLIVDEALLTDLNLARRWGREAE